MITLVEPSVAIDSIPQARYKHAMVYDPSFNQLIMFGGRYENSVTALLNNTWFFDCETLKWENANVTPYPPVRDGHNMVFDSKRNRVVLHSKFQTWFFNISSRSWHKIETSIYPESRTDFGMIFDPKLDQILLFGGFRSRGVYFDDLWAFNCSTNEWKLCNASETKPTHRYGISMVYNINSDNVILFGGQTYDGKVNEIWVLQPNTLTWDLLDPPTPLPDARYWSGLSLDEVNNRLILFGGSANYPSTLHNTWNYDLNNHEWTEFDFTNKPSRRLIHTMAYNNLTNQIFMYGGSDPVDLHPLNDLWIFDCSSDKWENIDFESQTISSNIDLFLMIGVISISFVVFRHKKLILNKH
jgi:N-acetylneuraminic acid mutarotase